MTAALVANPATPAYTRETRAITGRYIDVAVGAAASAELLPGILAGRSAAVDLETTGVDAERWNVKAVCIAAMSGQAAVVLDPRVPADAAMIRETLEQLAWIVIHNASFDAPVLIRQGLMAAAKVDCVLDTLLLARMANPGGFNNLASCAQRLLGMRKSPDPWKALPGRWTANRWYQTMDLGSALYLDGVVADALTTTRLVEPLQRELRALYANAPFWGLDASGINRVIEREHKILRMFILKTAAGYPVDLGYLAKFEDRYRDEVTMRTERLAASEIFPTKPASLSAWLAANIPIDDRWPVNGSGLPAAKKALLESMAHRIPQIADYLTVRNAAKVFTYLEGIAASEKATGMVHPTVNVCAARTGRMSIGSPPLQQFPASARGIFMSPFDAGLVSADWASMEVVVAAALGRDAGLLTDNVTEGVDLYDRAKASAGVDRNTAKRVQLAALYGQQGPSLARSLGVELEEALRIRKDIFATMPGITGLIDWATKIGRGGYVATIAGRVIPLGRRDDGKVKTYTATNYLVQGSSYDILAEVLAAAYDAGLTDRLFLAIHDEVVMDAAPDVVDAMVELMRKPPPQLMDLVGDLPLALNVDPEHIGDRWAKGTKSTDIQMFDADDSADMEDE